MRADSPWPTYRRDRRNTGCSSISAKYRGDWPRLFQTGKGVFSLPIIDGQGTIHVGSADHNFYCINTGSSLKWTRKTSANTWSLNTEEVL